MSLFNNAYRAAQKRAQYSKLKFQLQNMPVETAIDLGIFRDDAAKIASKAIYG